MIDPSKVALFVPPELKTIKLALFNRIGEHIKKLGGRVVRGDHRPLALLPEDIVPIVGCSPQLTSLIAEWRKSGRTWIYWDRSYARRVYATWLPRGENGGYYRWCVNSYQLRTIRDVPGDRWASLKTEVTPWQKSGHHIVVAEPTPTYARFHGIEGWTERTIAELGKLTDRKIVRRDKESKRPLQDDLRGAHALVAHGSNAAVESVICGCPVFVADDSAASLVGQTDLSLIETPVYPDRMPWCHSLAYSQFNESELVDGTLWKLIG